MFAAKRKKDRLLDGSKNLSFSLPIEMRARCLLPAVFLLLNLILHPYTYVCQHLANYRMNRAARVHRPFLENGRKPLSWIRFLCSFCRRIRKFPAVPNESENGRPCPLPCASVLREDYNRHQMFRRSHRGQFPCRA